jgi:hypothetical protein
MRWQVFAPDAMVQPTTVSTGLGYIPFFDWSHDDNIFGV